MIQHYSPKIEKIFQLATQQVGTRWHLARLKMIFARTGGPARFQHHRDP